MRRSALASQAHTPAHTHPHKHSYILPGTWEYAKRLYQHTLRARIQGGWPGRLVVASAALARAVPGGFH